MKKSGGLLFRGIGAMLALFWGLSLSSCTPAEEITINVSPAVLNLESDGGAFSIHTDLKYSSGMDIKVYLDNDRDAVTVSSYSADSRGELVVKCDLAEIKEITTTGSVVVKLTVRTKDGTSYAGTDTIEIIARGKS